jgi:hypothetical protein
MDINHAAKQDRIEKEQTYAHTVLPAHCSDIVRVLSTYTCFASAKSIAIVSTSKRSFEICHGATIAESFGQVLVYHQMG